MILLMSTNLVYFSLNSQQPIPQNLSALIFKIMFKFNLFDYKHYMVASY